MATSSYHEQLQRLFRPSEVVKLTLACSLLPPVGKGKAREEGVETRVIIGVVCNLDNKSGAEEGA
jgi:hypothetical protein